MLDYLYLDIICSSKLAVFLKLRSQKTVCLSEQILSMNKYASILWPQLEMIGNIHVVIFYWQYFKKYFQQISFTKLIDSMLLYICLEIDFR